MLGFKSVATACVILGGIEMVHMMRKGQAKYARNSNLSLGEQSSCSPHERFIEI
jgi:transposase-like protein